MAKEEIFDKLKELVVDQLGVDDDEVTTEATIQEDLGADSLDLVDLVMAVEEEFDVKIADEDLEGIKTVGDIVDYIAENKDYGPEFQQERFKPETVMSPAFFVFGTYEA